eukprot:g69884.t1
MSSFVSSSSEYFRKTFRPFFPDLLGFWQSSSSSSSSSSWSSSSLFSFSCSLSPAFWSSCSCPLPWASSSSTLSPCPPLPPYPGRCFGSRIPPHMLNSAAIAALGAGGKQKLFVG